MIEHCLAYKTDAGSYGLTPNVKRSSKESDVLLKMTIELADEALGTDVDLEQVHKCPVRHAVVCESVSRAAVW
jgi:hypothetical protein